MGFFTAEDFENYIKAIGVQNPVSSAKIVAGIAESKLQREAKVVYGEVVHGEFLWNHTSEYGDTHRALLICVEEIERKPCEHVPSNTKFIDPYLFDTKRGFANVDMDNNICAKCGVKLKATWEVVE